MHPMTRTVGAATITVLTTGMLHADLQDWLRVPAEQWAPEHRMLFAQPVVVPVQSLLVQVEGLTVLVDACDGAMVVSSPFEPPGYQPPPALPIQLATLGLMIDVIDVIAITHPHGNHIIGLATGEAGERVPVFPRARHLLQRADWELLAADLADESSLVAQTLGMVARADLLDVVDGPFDCGCGVSLVPAPGETPGHQIVRVASEGRVCYALGDLYHHAVEVAHPAWMVHWAEREATARSRATLVAAALAERALLVAGHIPTFGVLAPTETGVTWASA